MNVLLPTAYWPNLHYFYYVLNAETPVVEQHDHYHKQSYRNRCSILSANGVLHLTVPVKHAGNHCPVQDVEISYTDNWPLKHWRAICSAYGNSPYFDFFNEEVHAVYQQQYTRLVDLNLAQAETVLRLWRIEKKIILSPFFDKMPASHDLRDLIHPKREFSGDPLVAERLKTGYYQTFSNKFGFVPNLSILDLLFNTGLDGRTYLSRAF